MTAGMVSFNSNRDLLSNPCITGDLMYPNGCDCDGCRTHSAFPRSIFQPRGFNFNPFVMGGLDDTCFNPIKQRAEQLAVKEAISDLQDSILENDSEKILERWQDFKDAFKNTAEYRMLAMGNDKIDERQVNALMAQRYKMLTGQDIKKAIKENCNGNFVAGFKNLFGTGTKSADQLIEEMFKVSQPFGSSVKRGAGAFIPAITIGAGFGWFLGPVGAGIGAGVGCIWAGLSKIWS